MREDHEDNDGRRKTLRNWLTHDPFYRRIKDALLMLLAIFGASGMAGYDLPTLIRKITGKSEVTTTEEGRTETRAIRSEARSEGRDLGVRDRLIRLEVSLESVDKKVDKLEDKIDRLLESVRGR